MEKHNIHFQSPLSLISALTINADTEEFSFRLDLSRSESFPSHRFSCVDDKFHADIRYSTYQVPQNAAHLQLKLGDCLGFGATGTVYSAHISNSLSDLSPPVPQELIVKFARLNHCRSLAREAWIYNCLDENQRLTGTVVPRCYGFFTSKLTESGVDYTTLSSSELPFELPWSIYEFDRDPDRDNILHDDFDDEVVRPQTWNPGHIITKDSSPWNSWTPDPDDPLVAVLLLEKGGQRYTDFDDRDPLVREDVELVCEDLEFAGIAHNDFRMPNLIRAPPATSVCRRHKRVHTWNIIDFNQAWPLDLSVENFPRDTNAVLNSRYRSGYFYGWQ
ncbi:hypothetical protein GGU10DRAFT_301473 [Lentinula aff. detonsa]|uniref:Protein kinase domain-containing protein n=1 Tax=Lentinula aff. detonsa TaxID=2804958 RepID=A0AA38NU45_9AGAR|nr:hypothetical protein GGU10DRAFT_301473 [Lentinula aff. detonsa]